MKKKPKRKRSRLQIQRQRARDRKRSARASERREELISLITARTDAGTYVCAVCRLRHFEVDEIEVDHVDGITWDDRAVNFATRMERYHAEYAAGVKLRGLCKSCNSRDGAARGWRNGVYEMHRGPR